MEENTSEVSEENEANQMPAVEVDATNTEEVAPEDEENSDEHDIKKDDNGDSK